MSERFKLIASAAGPGPLYALVAFLIPLCLAAWLLATVGMSGGVALFVLALVPISVACVKGAQGLLMWGLGAALVGSLAEGELGILSLAVISVGLFVTANLHDWSRSLRRNPGLAPGLARGTIGLLGLVVVAALVLSAGAYALARVGEWPAITIPIAIVVIGAAIWLTYERLATALAERRST